MDSRRATIRNMRSKCRCSYVLQFTFRHAVCCVLHRPPSQVIHCTVLFSQSVDQNGLVTKFGIELTAPHEGGDQQRTWSRAKIFERFCHHRALDSGAPHPRARPPVEQIEEKQVPPTSAQLTASGRQQTGRRPQE